MTLHPHFDGGNCQNLPPTEIDRIFFPTNISAHGNGTRAAHLEREARTICADCPIRHQCLTQALRLGPQAAGIWGGTNDTERRRILGTIRTKKGTPRA
jgi:hypothetical protein